MDHDEMHALAARFLDAWNSQDVERVLGIYTDDVRYLDPNTRGAVEGSAALRRYLGKLFARWSMHWTLREAFLLDDRAGCAILWRARLTPAGSGRSVEIDGMDLAVVRGGRLARNEVYFDRAALAAVLS
jgi:ketosteroid isomerase-like protein